MVSILTILKSETNFSVDPKIFPIVAVNLNALVAHWTPQFCSCPGFKRFHRCHFPKLGLNAFTFSLVLMFPGSLFSYFLFTLLAPTVCPSFSVSQGNKSKPRFWFQSKRYPKDNYKAAMVYALWIILDFFFFPGPCSVSNPGGGPELCHLLLSNWERELAFSLFKYELLGSLSPSLF